MSITVDSERNAARGAQGTRSAAEARAYQICTFCIMDTTDPDIHFDAKGRCNHCRRHGRALAKELKRGPDANRALDELVATIKTAGRKREYDCIIGLSGGVDSTYVAWKVKALGLRPLAVHLDNGWNTVEAVSNIKNCVARLGIDLHTEVLDWEEFRDLQLAFLRASTPDSEIPTDHAIGGVMMKSAARYGLKYIIAGQNLQSEGLGPRAWSQGYHDWRYIKSVHRRFGTVPLRTFLHYSLLEHVYYKKARGIRRVDILNLLEYDKNAAKQLLIRELGWQDYGGKHCESVYTRFFQAYILPVKFNYDKRRAHMSTLISSGQLTREQALLEIEKPTAPPETLATDRQFVVKKLGLTDAEFEEIMALPPRSIFDYPSYERSFLYKWARKLYHAIEGNSEADLAVAT